MRSIVICFISQSVSRSTAQSVFKDLDGAINTILCGFLRSGCKELYMPAVGASPCKVGTPRHFSPGA